MELGLKYLYKFNELSIYVITLKIRRIFGRNEVLIKPASGYGEIWVNENTLKKDGEN